MGDNIKVVVKIRPLIPREIDEKLTCQWRVRNNTLYHEQEAGVRYTFDKVYDQNTKTKEVFDDIAKPIVEAAISGFNGTIFAYGQTSSGKTYTMTGTEESPGIIPMAVLHLFEKIKSIPDRDFLVRVSYIEIYNETLKDLLQVDKKNIKIHDTIHGVKVDVTEKVTSSPEEVLDAMKKGEANRMTGATNMNEESSRSHSIFQITIESREHIEGEKEVGCVNVSQLNLVDLAGSERAGQTGATGIRFKEGTLINKSLSVLGLVIKQLSEDPHKYANYRDSKLTRILQNSLGGNAKTSIICAITPASVEETVSTLQFANRAKAIQNKPEVNAVATNATMIQSLTKQLSKLQSQLESKKNIEQDNANLQKQIIGLQKLILNGFGQNTTLNTARRKVQQPRRVTIHSTLHTVSEDPEITPTIPKFCTPGLKYNPLITPGASDFVPIQNASKLTTVPEETSSRMVTPPLRDKHINYEDEIIDLDSEHDNSTDIPPCSPYHKCYGSSKTPPCVLRNNAKQAEKKLKDIEELTEREKLYPPDVVDLMEKLEQQTNIITELKEEINTLTEQGKEKESKMIELSNKVKKTEEELQSIGAVKVDLEKRCNAYDSKITDWEVSYETLQNKFKTREKELLSLLEDASSSVKKSEAYEKHKGAEKETFHFMDMSKDISLVNSDTESSIVNTNDDAENSVEKLQELVTNLQEHLKTKDQNILELQTTLASQMQRIESLEISSIQLQGMVDSCKEKLKCTEGENEHLKASVISLNSVIENQKQHLDTAAKDIESYNNTIEKLQQQLNSMESLVSGKIDDVALEAMIANENQLIASNQNLRNIILSFKAALETRNSQINSLKSSIKDHEELESTNISLKNEVEFKDRQLNVIVAEMESLKEQITENIEMISKLISTEETLNKNLTDQQNQNKSLQQFNQEKCIQIKNLEEDNDKLLRIIAEKELKEDESASINDNLRREIDILQEKIGVLAKDVERKTRYEIGQEIKIAVNKLKELLCLFNCEENSITEDVIVDDLDNYLNVLQNSIQLLLTSSRKLIDEKKQITENFEIMKQDIVAYKYEIENLKTTVHEQNIERNQLETKHANILEQAEQLKEEIDKLHTELSLKQTKIDEVEKSVSDLQSRVDKFIACQNEYVNREEEMTKQIEQLTEETKELSSSLEIKDKEISRLQDFAAEIDAQKNKLFLDNESYSQQMSSLQKELELISVDLSEKNILIRELQQNLSGCTDLKAKIEILTQEQNVVVNANKDLTTKVTNLMEELDKVQNTLHVKNKEFDELLTQNLCFKSEIDDLINERNKLILENKEMSSKLESSTAQLERLNNLMNDKDTNNENILSNEWKQEKEILLSRNEILSHDVEQLSKVHSEALNDIELKEQQIIDLQAKLKEADVANIDLQHQIEELNITIAEIMRCNESLSCQIKQLIDIRDEITNDLEIKKQEFIDLLSILSTVKGEIPSKEIILTQIKNLQETKDELLLQVTKLNGDIDAVQKELEIKEKLIDKLETSLNDARAKNSDLSNIQRQFDELSEIKNELVRQNEHFKLHTTGMIEQFNNLRIELDIKNNDITDLESKLNLATTENEDLRNDISCKENIILSLQDKLSVLHMQIQSLNEKEQVGNINDEMESLKSEIKSKDIKIKELEHLINRIEGMLEEEVKKSKCLQEHLNESLKSRKIILEKILEIARDLKITHELVEEQNTGISEENIIPILEIVRNYVMPIITSESTDLTQILRVAKEDIVELTKKNLKLMSEYSDIATKNRELCGELEKVNNFNRDLLKTTELMIHLKSELSEKSDELTDMEAKVKMWKEQFGHYEELMKEQMVGLQFEKDNLEYLQSSWKQNTICRNIPQSLFTICCNKIVDAIHHDDKSESSKSSVELHRVESETNICDAVKGHNDPSSESSIELRHTEGNTKICECPELSMEMQFVKEENKILNDIVKDLKISNQQLINEREEVRTEVQQLIEYTVDLQKKIVNHRTNLSTLTATTYAENKLLNSQLKVLKHYHTRYIHVCQRDIPAVKTQLNELMSILKDNSYLDKHNSSFKRYSLPDVLDNNSMISNFKNDSTLDGELLMLDTNVTLATNADNTLIGHDQSCLDVTQIHFDTEVACQTNDLSKCDDQNSLKYQIESLTEDNKQLIQMLEALQEENTKLNEEVNNLRMQEHTSPNLDAQCSPFKSNVSYSDSHTSDEYKELKLNQEKLLYQVNCLTQQLQEAANQKTVFEQKYTDLLQKATEANALVKKLEKDCLSKAQEVEKCIKDLGKKNCLIKELQEENDSLSTQVMESITEIDDLRKELNMLKVKCTDLEQVKNNCLAEPGICPQCTVKDSIIKSLESRQKIDQHSKLNRSLSDSESSSRLNKLSTLQSELDASKEDCKKITEEVATIKNHLGMDLDDSMGDSNIFSFTKNLERDEQRMSKFMPNIPEERPTDSYTLDKIDCFNFYADKTGVEKENLSCDMKIIDVMKMFYDSILTKHGNEVQNLFNNIRDLEEKKNELKSQIETITSQNSSLKKSVEENNLRVKSISDVVTKLMTNMNSIQKEMSNDNQLKIVSLFKDDYLKVLDIELGLSSTDIFDTLIDSLVAKHQFDLGNITESYTQLQKQMESMNLEFNAINDQLKGTKEQLSKKECEYSLLKDQKERIHEISNAVTLDLIKRDREISSILKNCCDKLLKINVISNLDVDPTLGVNDKIKLVLEHLSQSLIEGKSQETENLRKIVEAHKKEVDDLKCKIAEKDRNLRSQTTLYDDLSKLYQHTLEVNNDKIEKLNGEINVLKEKLASKEDLIQILDGKLSSKLEESFSESINEFMQKINSLEQENANLKSVNEMLKKEKESVALELEKSAEMIRINKKDIDTMTADILVLRESITENVSTVESLKLESKSLLEKNMQLKKEFEDKCQEYSRLETNIKIHEKAAEIQSKTIIRLQKQKEEEDKVIEEKNKLLDELQGQIKSYEEEIEKLRSLNTSLESRLADLQNGFDDGAKRRQSVDIKADNTRRRRQSIHDSMRMFSDQHIDHSKFEAVFNSREKPNDLFMEIDSEGSNRSTPHRLSRGHDSFQSRHEQSDDDPPSRPSSVMATRLRRQSIHDQHRNTLQRSLSPKGGSLLRLDGENIFEITERNDSDSEVSQLRESLASCQQELEELKERYRELDDECETCAQYLRERDEQCARLKREKAALENQVTELNERLKGNKSLNTSSVKVTYAHASVNTDTDWANLHSVVVDRMSFDAEVEKNKKLTRTIEELRYNKQELKNTMAKMQKNIEKLSSSKELETTRSELKKCKEELAELKERYKELDDECETCAMYLRERDEQCRKLKEAKAILEEKLLELQDNGVSQSARKKRQSMYDQNRVPAAQLVDAATETSDDLLTYVVERDHNPLKATDNIQPTTSELKRLKTALEKALKDKAILEHKVLAMAAPQQPQVLPTMYVATGSAIVQNQQLTDVMRENQKLKKMNANLIKICKKRNKSAVNQADRDEDSVGQD